MEIDTRRLRLIPFSEEIIQAAMGRDRERLAALGIVADEEWPEPDLVEALPHFRRLIRDHGLTGFNGWLVLDRRTREIVGSLGFIGEPDEKGSIEIGFGMVPGRRRQGYCEEAARALIGWAEGRAGGPVDHGPLRRGQREIDRVIEEARLQGSRPGRCAD